ncbi:hypothetical protein HMI54_015583, partial [Coelomomyces lativittatus]
REISKCPISIHTQFVLLKVWGTLSFPGNKFATSPSQLGVQPKSQLTFLLVNKEFEFGALKVNWGGISQNKGTLFLAFLG